MTALLQAAILLTGLFFVIGVVSSFTWDIRETCGLIHNVRYDPTPPPDDGLTWPFSVRCNADHDLVPAWVNPGFIASASVGVVALAGFVIQMVRVNVRREPAEGAEG